VPASWSSITPTPSKCDYVITESGGRPDPDQSRHTLKSRWRESGNWRRLIVHGTPATVTAVPDRQRAAPPPKVVQRLAEYRPRRASSSLAAVRTVVDPGARPDEALTDPDRVYEA